MVYRRIAPGAEAAPFVDHYWILRGAPDGVVQRVVPDGSPELILNLCAPFEFCEEGVRRAQARCFVAGQIVAPLLLRPAGAVHILSVRFQPHGLAAVLDAPVHELTGGFLEVDPGDVQTIPQLEAWLLRRVRRDPDAVVSEAARRISAAFGTCDIAVLARDLAISTRHLERRFLQQTGLPPKLYARMRRFQSVFPSIERGTGWAAAAIACGYYDQAHLIRDFREFAGEPPASLAASDDLARHFLSHFSKTAGSSVR